MKNCTKFYSCLGIVALVVLLIAGCKSDYQQYVDRELSKQESQDSLILGIHFGMTRAAYFKLCGDLNQQRLVTQGDGGNRAKYIEPFDSTNTEDITRKEFQFAPYFDSSGVVIGLEIIGSYIAWAPWQEELQSEQVIREFIKEYEAKFGGNKFIEIKLDEVEVPVYVKIDANRQILIFKKGAKDAIIRMEDIRLKYKSE